VAIITKLATFGEGILQNGRKIVIVALATMDDSKIDDLAWGVWKKHSCTWVRFNICKAGKTSYNLNKSNLWLAKERRQ
jgi:hypothetical protein